MFDVLDHSFLFLLPNILVSMLSNGLLGKTGETIKLVSWAKGASYMTYKYIIFMVVVFVEVKAVHHVSK